MDPTRAAKVRLSTKGQLVLPRTVRERHGWHAGTELMVSEAPGGVLITPVTERTATIDDLVGCVGYDGPPRSIAEMDAAIVAEARRRERRRPPTGRRKRKVAA